MNNISRRWSSAAMLMHIEGLLRDNKAELIRKFDLRQVHPLLSYIIIAQGLSVKHVNMLAKKVYKEIKDLTADLPVVDGAGKDSWIAIDWGEIMVHILDDASRKKYDMETFWCALVERSR